MDRFVKFGLALTLILLGALNVEGETANPDCENLTSSRQANQVGNVSCISECESYYQENPNARPANGASICQVGAVERAYRMMNPLNCWRGAWDGVLSLPQTLKAYGLMVEDVGGYIRRHVREHHSFVMACEQDSACRREVARSFTQYSQRDNQGRYSVSDETVDSAIRGSDINHLLMTASNHTNSFHNFCMTQLHRIQNQLRLSGLAPFEFALQRYQKLGEFEPKCIGSLQMRPPRPEQFRERETVDFLAAIGIRLQCYPPDKISELLCYEVAALVVDPVNLVGSGLIAKAAAKAGVTARNSARVLGARLGTRGELTLVSNEARLFDFTRSGTESLAHTYTYKVGTGSGLRELEVVIPATSSGAISRGQAEMVREMLGSMPESALTNLDTLVVNPQRYVHDAHWAKEYSTRDFRAAATGGPGPTLGSTQIDFYPAGLRRLMTQTERSSFMGHELGHVIAQRRFGTVEPPAEYLAAIKRDGRSVSRYGDNAPREDLAEAVAAYIRTEGGIHNPQLLARYQHRFQFIDDLMRLDPVQKREVFAAYQARLREIHGVTLRRISGATTMVINGRIIIIPDQTE